MRTAKKTLTHQLVAVLESYLDDEATPQLAPDVIATVLRKLAKHVQQSGKVTAGKNLIAPPTAKHARKALTKKLTSEVQAHLGSVEQLPPAPAKALAKTIKHLAKQVVQQQRRQPTPAAEPSRPAAPAPKPTVTAPVSTPVSPSKPAPAARRPPVKQAVKAAPKLPAASAASGGGDAAA